MRILGLLLFLATQYAFASPVAAQSRAAGFGDIATLLQEMQDVTAEALAAAEEAAEASSIEDVKRGADAVYRLMWGLSSGRADPEATGAVAFHGWKEQWQANDTDFDSVYAARYSGLPPRITDPAELGLIGRGRAARRLLNAVVADSTAPEAARLHAGHVLISLNNVIGWMEMQQGFTKGEIQPRIDLTRVWDAPIEFWQSTADTGWAHEVVAQAINILKVEYDHVAEARSHAAAMADLVRRYESGIDADGDGTIAPVMMEGGLATAVRHAALAR